MPDPLPIIGGDGGGGGTSVPMPPLLPFTITTPLTTGVRITVNRLGCVCRSLPPLPPPSTVTMAAPTPPETPLGSVVGDGGPQSPQFVYVTAAVSAAPLTPPASENSSDAENTPVDAGGTQGNPAAVMVATATATTTVYSLIDYVIERSDGGGAYDPLLTRDLNVKAARTTTTTAEHHRSSTTTTTTTTTQVVVGCSTGNKGQCIACYF